MRKDLFSEPMVKKEIDVNHVNVIQEKMVKGLLIALGICSIFFLIGSR